MYFRWRTVLIDTIGISAIGEAKFREGRKSSSRVAARLVSWVKIDGHQCPWAASRLEQGIAPPRRPRSGGVTAAPQIPTLRRRRPSGRTVIRTCRRYPCEAVPHYFVIVPRGVFRGTSSLFLSIHARKFLDMHVSLHKLPLLSSDSPCFHLFFVYMWKGTYRRFEFERRYTLTLFLWIIGKYDFVKNEFVEIMNVQSINWISIRRVGTSLWNFLVNRVRYQTSASHRNWKSCCYLILGIFFFE